MQPVLVSGSLAYDRIMNFHGHFKEHIMPEKIHVLNVSFVVETVEERYGGTAGNIAYNLAILGYRPLLLSAVGGDFDRYRAHLKESGVDTSYIEIFKDTKTAFANIITDLDDNQITAFHPGALAKAHATEEIPQDVSMALVAPEAKDVMIARVKIYQRSGLRYLFDPGQQVPAFSGEELMTCIQGAYMLIGNDYEISLLAQKTGLGISDLVKSVNVLITTLGEQGSLIQTREGERIEVAAVPPSKFVDPTGAGDAYRAGFVAGLLAEKSLAECGRIASTVASRAIEHYGAQEHTFVRNEVELQS